MSTARENRLELLLDFKMYTEYTNEYTPETLLFLFDVAVADINSYQKKKIDLGRTLAHVSFKVRLDRIMVSDIVIGISKSF